jgi:hypothetical protein
VSLGVVADRSSIAGVLGRWGRHCADLDQDVFSVVDVKCGAVYECIESQKTILRTVGLLQQGSSI